MSGAGDLFARAVELEAGAPSGALALAGVRVGAACPVTVYLAGRALGSRRAMRGALALLAAIIAGDSKTIGPDGLPAAGADIDLRAVPWERLTHAETSALRAKLIERGYAPTYSNKIICALRGLLKTCWRLGLMDSEQYSRAIDLEPIGGSRVLAGREAKGDELRRLFESCAADPKRSRGLRDAAIISLLYGAGLRRSEVAGLALADYLPDDRALRVFGKGNKERIVPLPSWADVHLTRWIERRGDVAGGLICPVTIHGNPVAGVSVGQQQIYMALMRRMSRAGVSGLTPHSLRRSFASELLERSGDLIAVQKLLGHAKTDTTEKYLRRQEQQKRRAAEMLPDPTA